jgi:glutamate synthase (NADPH/NADH) small chain
MGEIGGFLKYYRKTPDHRDVKERVGDYKPVEFQPLESQIHAQAARCMDCGTPFCHGYGCPLCNVVPELMDLVYRNRWQEALEVLLSKSPFPEFTARICPALCEASCVLGISDEPVTIRQIELAIIEKAFEKGYIKPRPPVKRLDGKVAVIGSGPAGLAAADVLNRAGYRVTVYDKARNAGGILRYGIPDFKLEKSVVERRIKLMRDEGVVFEMGVSAGDDISHKYLKSRFNAICLAGGARQPRDLAIPGRKLKGIHFAMEYLVQQNQRIAGEKIDRDEITAEGKNVVIIGGGDTGSDCLGTALRQKAARVRQFEILPKPSLKRPETTPWPMWPNIYRESSSHEEGGDRRWCVTTKEFLGKKGHLTGVRCAEVEWSEARNGMMEFREKANSEFEVEAELALLSMGFTGQENGKLIEDLNIERDSRGNIRVDARHMTNVEGVFASGDMARGQSLVVRAIADGRAAASGIIEYLEKAGGKGTAGGSVKV